MVCQKTNFKAADQNEERATRQINVTDLTPNQRRELFKNCFGQDGFTGFIKHKENKQTYYTFKYENL